MNQVQTKRQIKNHNANFVTCPEKHSYRGVQVDRPVSSLPQAHLQGQPDNPQPATPGDGTSSTLPAPSPMPGTSLGGQPDAWAKMPPAWPQLDSSAHSCFQALAYQPLLAANGMIQLARFPLTEITNLNLAASGQLLLIREHRSSGSFQSLLPLIYSQPVGPISGKSQPGQRCDFSRQPHFQGQIFGKANKAPALGPLLCLGPCDSSKMLEPLHC